MSKRSHINLRRARKSSLFGSGEKVVTVENRMRTEIESQRGSRSGKSVHGDALLYAVGRQGQH